MVLEFALMTQLYFVQNNQDAKRLSRLYRQHKLRRIYHGIYTDNLKTPLSDIVLQYWMSIVSHILPQAILSFSTALRLKPSPFKNSNIVFVTSSYHKTIVLPGLMIKVIAGNMKDDIEQVLPSIARSNQVRTWLENLLPVRSASYRDVKTVGAVEIENMIARELALRGESNINKLRDDAKKISVRLHYDAADRKLNTIISALLSTKTSHVLQSSYAKSVVKKEPYDQHCIILLEKLMIFLKKCEFLKRQYQYQKNSFKNISFFESYFSNFIEGTEFLIDEAENIAFSGKTVRHRHADSHDILSHFTLSNDFSEMSITPNNPKELLQLLQKRHAYLMKERPEKQPGHFKTKPNKAGNTYFVAPEKVIGTLCHAFELYHALPGGLEKALFMQFLISEVHPFDDGNGRLSRMMMNAECVKEGLFKIIVPTVMRDNYLNGLRLASRDGNFQIFCKVMDQCQAYANSINWIDYASAREKIEQDCAQLTADEGLPFFNRVLRQLLLSSRSLA